MDGMNIISSDYRLWIGEIKRRIRQCQIQASVKVNTELLQLYWDIASDVVEKQKNARWGDGFLKQMSKDLTEEFPEMKGFSVRNLQSMCRWYIFYSHALPITKQLVSQLNGEKTKQLVSQNSMDVIDPSAVVRTIEDDALVLRSFFSVPWGHHILIMQRCKEIEKALFYIQQTVENGWSRSILDWQIDSRLYERQGKAISNFAKTLPTPQSELAQQVTKDPYVIDIMGIRQDLEEREIEAHLDTHISQYLLELGKGFTYYGRQIHLKVDGDDYYIDQLFYHVRLHCYVVVELKAVKFKPEHIGQLNFYVAAVDAQLRAQEDNPTIGLLICKDKNDVVAEYSLRNVMSPIGVSSIQIYDQLTADYKSSLPTIQEIEDHLKGTE